MVLQKKKSEFGQKKRKNLAPEHIADSEVSNIEQEKGHQEDMNQQWTDIIQGSVIGHECLIQKNQ